MSSRRNGSVSRAAETASKTRLHMDRNPQVSRINDPSNPAGRRKELDNVMKRARQASPGSWDRKLLEVEEKDPNRWRHTGYKQMYLNGSRSPSSRRSRSPSGRRSRSPMARKSRSPIPRRSSRSPAARGRRSPPPPRRSPPRRSPPRRSPPRRSPPTRREPVRDPRTDPRRLAARQERRRESPARRPMSPRRPPPSPRDSSGSGSSGSSCSDESCSVCSAKNKKTGPPAKPGASPSRKRPRPPSPPPNAVKPTRELLKAREASKRSREQKVLDWQREQLSMGVVRVKRESGSRSPPSPPSPRSPRDRLSPHALAKALAVPSAPTPRPSQTKLTLSERFGKMAQWSAARSARLENMRITRQETTLHVHIEPTDREDPEPVLEAADVGSYPEELLAAAPAGLPSWDDVRVRYDYYKKRGYLRDLSLGDYVKWEEWWYKYQEWLKRERAYERWADGEAPVRRERRRRGGRHRRS